ncbi:MAG TPA: DUF1572 family protein [Flavisolibacter sp.]|nr:DUF1572 family protein [Flavisolibacter sp.]
MNIATELLTSYVKRFREYKALGDKTFAQLTDHQMHQQPNEASNSIAIIIQHMHGNMLSRWTNFLTEDGEKSWRNREAEFEAQSQSKEQLLNRWEEGWKVVLATLESLEEVDLLKTITIRTQPLIVIDAINRQLAHYSYHVGQIVYLGRWMKEGEWMSLSIPKGESVAFNDRLAGKTKAS